MGNHKNSPTYALQRSQKAKRKKVAGSLFKETMGNQGEKNGPPDPGNPESFKKSFKHSHETQYN